MLFIKQKKFNGSFIIIVADDMKILFKYLISFNAA